MYTYDSLQNRPILVLKAHNQRVHLGARPPAPYLAPPPPALQDILLKLMLLHLTKSHRIDLAPLLSKPGYKPVVLVECLSLISISVKMKNCICTWMKGLALCLHVKAKYL